ncbi:MAG TPA: YHS domain-containing protein [Bryobacteraceae bacterium]|nr:YHS domain-containing protein [Bryobacteraceae bacterium]
MPHDPVCGAKVNENKAPAASIYQGERYVSCGQECKDKFDKNPQQYTKSKEPQHVGR